MSEDARSNIGWIIIGLILFSILKNFFVVIFYGAASARMRIREIFDAEDMEEESNSTSDEAFENKRRPSTISDNSSDDLDDD